MNAIVRLETMKIQRALALAAIVLAAGCCSTRLTPQGLAEKRARYEPTTGALELGRIEVRNATHEHVFQLAEQLAKQHDSSGVGVEIIVPAAPRERAT